MTQSVSLYSQDPIEFRRVEMRKKRYMLIAALVAAVAVAAIGTPAVSAGGDPAMQTPYIVFGNADYQLETVDATIQAATLDVGHLRAWQLCSTEMIAASQANLALANASRQFPKNLPVGPGPAADEQKFIARKLYAARVYAKAAILAKQAGIACVAPGALSHKSRYISLVSKDDHGKPMRIKASDYAVMYPLQPLEYPRLASECPAALRRYITKTRLLPVDKVVSSAGEIGTFSQQDKAVDLGLVAADLRMLTTAGTTCPA